LEEGSSKSILISVKILSKNISKMKDKDTSKSVLKIQDQTLFFILYM